jgi:cytochrome c
MTTRLLTLLVTGLMSAAVAGARADGLALAQKNGCLACHAINQKVLGPAYQDVAAKYKGDSNALAKLSAKIKSGGSGVWGPVPMPPHPQLTDEERKTLVEWILSLKA